MPHDEKRTHTTSLAQTAERDEPLSALDTATHAGHLALAIGESAASATNKDALARELAGLLARELGPATAAWYWCEQQPNANSRQQPQLRRAVMMRRGHLPSRAQGRILRSSAEAAATSRHLVLRSSHTNELDEQVEQIVACPLGTPAPVAVLVMASPTAAADIRSHRVAVLSRLLPTLALAVNQYAPKPKEASQAAASGLLAADYLSILSHDLRTPLHTLGGFLEMVHDGMAGTINERQQEFLGYARTGAHQLGAMLEDVLYLSRADSNHLTLRSDRVELAPVLYDVLNTAQSEAQIKHVAVIADLPQDIPALLGDEDRLKHAFARIVSHAISRAPTSSTVKISATTAEDTVTITVKDAGPAISEQQSKTLFSYVARKGASRASEGLHLGLSVARLLVEVQRGHVELLHSTKGETIVAATLPAAV
jgi:signal transduction histidine kinase